MSCCAACGQHGCVCGCGERPRTPLSLYNRPGLPALRYRAGTYGDFAATMEAALSGSTLPALAGLRTRDLDDPAMALLDAWAVVADVLTFYQERIANEGYLRTATERFSLAALARLVGYEPRPGVAASLHLAYTLDDTAAPVTIPAGARAQSVPGPGEKMQSFETSDDLLARPDWNRLAPRTRALEQISRESALTRKALTLAGAATRLGPGDRLLFVFDDEPGQQIVRRVAAVEADFSPGQDRLQVTLEASSPLTLEDAELVFRIRDDVHAMLKSSGAVPELGQLAAALHAYLLGGSAADLVATLEKVSLDPKLEKLSTAIQALIKAMEPRPGVVPDAPPKTLFDILADLRKAPRAMAAASSTPTRALRVAGDAVPRLLERFTPSLGGVLYGAWRNLGVSPTAPTLRALFVLRVRASLFASGVPTSNGGTSDGPPILLTGKPPSAPPLHLDAVYEGIVADGWALVRWQERIHDKNSNFRIRIVASRVAEASTVTHSETKSFGTETTTITGPCTRLVIAPTVEPGDTLPATFDTSTLVFAQSEPLELAGSPVGYIQGDRIELDDLHDGLAPGRFIIVTGERRDVAGAGGPVLGIKGGEVALIADVEQADDPAVPGDHTHTTLVLASALAYAYAPETVVIYGNVAHATHGETHTEVLGSGDARKPMQRFALKQPPLTHVAAPTPAGVASTLEVRANDVRWHETTAPALAAPVDRVYVVRQDDDGTTSVGFGGRSARLPTGSENVRATYRSGIGVGGNVKAGQVSLLATKPSGVRDVVNPLRASGGAERDGIDQIRRNAPIAVAALDRLVSLQDYADFARTFAGVGHAVATRATDDRGELVHVTIAGNDDAPIDDGSDLHRALVAALNRFGDSQVRVMVTTRELVALVIRATVALDPDHAWKLVEPKLRAALVDRFAFTRRALGARAYASEAIAALQAVPGVRFVDLDVFDGIAESELSDPAVLEAKLAALAKGEGQPKPFVPEETALGDEDRRIRPARLAYVVPTVPETVSLAPR